MKIDVYNVVQGIINLPFTVYDANQQNLINSIMS